MGAHLAPEQPASTGIFDTIIHNSECINYIHACRRRGATPARTTADGGRQRPQPQARQYSRRILKQETIRLHNRHDPGQWEEFKAGVFRISDWAPLAPDDHYRPPRHWTINPGPDHGQADPDAYLVIQHVRRPDWRQRIHVTARTEDAWLTSDDRVIATKDWTIQPETTGPMDHTS